MFDSPFAFLIVSFQKSRKNFIVWSYFQKKMAQKTIFDHLILTAPKNGCITPASRRPV